MKKLSDDQLNKIAGGIEPEEKIWTPQGYQVPTKQNDEKGFIFSSVEEIIKQFENLYGSDIDEDVKKVVDILIKVGKVAAIEKANILFANNETKRNAVINVLNTF